MREYPSLRNSILIGKHTYQEAVDYLAGRVEVDYHDSDDSLSGEQLRERLGDKQGATCRPLHRIDAALMDAASSVRVVSNLAGERPPNIVNPEVLD